MYIKKHFSLFFLLFCNSIFANNVKIEDVRLKNQNITTNVKDIRFDISWDNSWRTSASPYNWDACWVFAKYRILSEPVTVWHHATLSTLNSDHTAPTGSTINAASDGKGAFIYRSSDGIGSNNWDYVALSWKYGDDGLGDDDSVEICVFAIEMVNIPSGNFTLGDGNGSTKSKYSFESAANDNKAVNITNSLSEGKGIVELYKSYNLSRGQYNLIIQSKNNKFITRKIIFR